LKNYVLGPRIYNQLVCSHTSSLNIFLDIFCKIIKGELEDVVYQDDEVVVLNDISPKAPIHLLVIPKKHFESVDDFSEKDSVLLGKLFLIAAKCARDAGLKDGYRLVVNKGPHGGQIVQHLHIHVLGGKNLGSKILHR
jgi:histidine triad (HIT) family protein